MNVLLVLPLILPMACAALMILFRRRLDVQRALTVAGTAALLLVSLVLLAAVWREGVISTSVGGWEAPFGVVLAADLLGAIMVVLTALMGFAVAIYGLPDIDEARERAGYHPIYQTLLMGVCGAFLTGDMFNLYVWFEVLLISSFVLLTIGGTRAQLEGALKYVTINLIGSATFLAACGFLYGATGTLNMAQLSRVVAATDRPGLMTALSMLFLVAFGVKAAIFPLFFWLPASYHTPPAAVSALFAGLLTKVGVYTLIRAFTLIFRQDDAFTHTLILFLAGATMIVGVLGAVAQNEMRRILSFHIVSQIGYMIMGLGLMTPWGLAGSVFYLMHHIVVKTNLFLVAGFVRRLEGSYDLDSLGGLATARPWVGVAFMIPAMALAGIPPLSGFWAKLLLIREGLGEEAYLVVFASLVAGLLTLYSMTKIWAGAFWGEVRSPNRAPGAKPDRPLDRAGRSAYILPIASLCAITVLVGLAVEPMLKLSLRAGRQLANPAEYADAVLGPIAPASDAPSGIAAPANEAAPEQDAAEKEEPEA